MLQAVTSGLLYYAVAYWLYLVALRLMPASVAGGFLNLVPLFGIATAYLVLGERLSPAQWAGGILILLAALSLLRLQGVPSRHRLGSGERHASHPLEVPNRVAARRLTFAACGRRSSRLAAEPRMLT
jgi:multidrug transporter EmrE-like cation transporter